MSQPKKNLVFFHPDLGIGGAERLVVDAAVGLQNRGYTVTIFTSHCDARHCFDEARNGTLDVRVRGNSIVPTTILGRFSILCAILRQLHLVIQIWSSGELARLKANAFFIDQLSACVPILRSIAPDTRILFYCHFPDKLLATRSSWIKELYRVPFDWLEAWTTGNADGLIVNSNFTKTVFARAFPSLRRRIPSVVYPCVNTNGEETVSNADAAAGEGRLWKGKKIILSINRFERKKAVGLAIEAYARLSPSQRADSRLVLAGGYDPRVAENVLYHRELLRQAESQGLKTATTQTVVGALDVPSEIEVLFLLSVPGSLKSTLLRSARLLVYTPANEHFGIVPLEAMLAGTPVLAVDSGGPLETVLDGQTGWLRSADDSGQWADVMDLALSRLSERERAQMGATGRKRVQAEFSQEKMALRLDEEISQMQGLPRVESIVTGETIFIAIMVGVLSVFISSVIRKHPSMW